MKLENKISPKPANSVLQTNKNSSSSFFRPIVQPKLTINQPNDIFEQEADAIADKVMRMRDIKTEALFFQPKPLSLTPVQRKCAACASEDKLHRKEDKEEEPIQLKPATEFDVQRKCSQCEEEKEKLQMKGESTTSGGMTAPHIVNSVINSTGQPLDSNARNFMESRIGYDFSNVQIHNDSTAHESSAALNALAYTHANHVVFGVGKYNPGSETGRRLLAHELTHVIQQNKSHNNLLQKKGTDDVEEESAREGDRFSQARRRDLTRIIDSMRFKKILVSCPKSTNVKLLPVLAEMRTRVAGNEKCLKFFKTNFKINPDVLLDPNKKPSISVDNALKVSGSTRCPEPAVKIGNICNSPHLERVIIHELTHYAQCALTGVPSSEELAQEGENICMGTAQEAVDRARKKKEQKQN
jgi:hypothetical protein